MTVVEKLRIWGIKGAIDFLQSSFRSRRIAREFIENARQFPCENPQMGITVVGYLSNRGSLNKVLRDFCFSLKDAKIPFQSYDLGANQVPEEDVTPILTPRNDFRIKKYTNLVEMISSPVPDGIVEKRGRIVFWEFESGLLQGYPTLIERSGSIIAMSDFNYNYYRKVFTDKRDVRKILYPLRLEIGSELIPSAARVKFGIPNDAFVVFYNFSYRSGIDRKNLEAIVRTFAKALPEMRNAILVLKTVDSDEFPLQVNYVKSWVTRLNIEDRVLFINDFLSQRDVLNLTNACDVYLSLHRAEGFGLGIVEAMLLGKPVVVTKYSSTTEFCDSSNSVLIGYDLVAMGATDNKLYNSAEKWAEPKIEEASKALVRLCKDRDMAARLGAAAKKSIRQRYSISKFRKSVLDYLHDTRNS